MTAVVSAETGGTGGCHVISRPHSHWKGQRYNYTHQRKSRDSETEACSAHLQRHKYPECGQKVPKQEFVFQTHRAWIIISFRHCVHNGNFLSFLMEEECSGSRKNQWSSNTISALFQTFMYIQEDQIKLQVGVEGEGHIVLLDVVFPACNLMVSRCG